MRGEFAGDAVMGGGLVCWCMVRLTLKRWIVPVDD